MFGLFVKKGDLYQYYYGFCVFRSIFYVLGSEIIDKHLLFHATTEEISNLGVSCNSWLTNLNIYNDMVQST